MQTIKFIKCYDHFELIEHHTKRKRLCNISYVIPIECQYIAASWNTNCYLEGTFSSVKKVQIKLCDKQTRPNKKGLQIGLENILDKFLLRGTEAELLTTDRQA